MTTRVSRGFGGKHGRWFRFTKTRFVASRRGKKVGDEEQKLSMVETGQESSPSSRKLSQSDKDKACPSSPRSLYMSITDCSISSSSSSSFSEDDYEEEGDALAIEALDDDLTESSTGYQPSSTAEPRETTLGRKRKFGTTQDRQRSLKSSKSLKKSFDGMDKSKPKTVCFGERETDSGKTKSERPARKSKGDNVNKSKHPFASDSSASDKSKDDTLKANHADLAMLDFDEDNQQPMSRSKSSPDDLAILEFDADNEEVNQPSSNTSLRKARAYFERLDQQKLEVVKEQHNTTFQELSAELNPPPSPVPGKPVCRTQRGLSVKTKNVRNVYQTYLDACKEADVKPLSLDKFWEQRRRQRLVNSPKAKVYDGFFEES